MPKVKVQKMVLRAFEVDADEIVFINTRGAMAENQCNGHNGVLGSENPKASVRVGNERFLLCKSCWQSQRLKQHAADD